MISIYISDYVRVGGLNTHIKGWETEDTNFAERVVRKRLGIFRAAALDLNHIYHPKVCGKNLRSRQYSSCKIVKWRSEFSEQILTAIFYDKYNNYTID